MANLRIYDMPLELTSLALDIAKRFARAYPDRVGIRNGVGHSLFSGKTYKLYVYRTKGGMIVVRGEG